MTVRDLREILGVSRAEFSRKYRIPPRTLQNWEAGTRTCPDYLARLLGGAVAIEANQKMKEGFLKAIEPITVLDCIEFYSQEALELYKECNYE